MTVILYLLAGLALLGAMIILLPLELRVRYGREGEEDLLRLQLSVWPGIRFELKLVMLDFSSSISWNVFSFRGEFKGISKTSGFTGRKNYSASEIFDLLRLLREMSDIFKTLSPSLHYLVRSIKMTRLIWKTGLGTGNPYYTALAAGAAWSFKGFIVTALCSRLRVSQKPVFSVEPYFNSRNLNVTLDCILRIRTGHIIFTGLRMLTALILSGKAGRLLKIIFKPGRRYGYARTSH